MRKIFFYLVVGILLFSVGAPVFAADSIYLGKTYTCTCGSTCVEYTWPYERALDATVDTCSGAGCTIGSLGSSCEKRVMRNCKEAGKDCISLENPLDIKDAEISIPFILGNVIKGFLGVIGSLALLMMVWGGFQWLTSMGNPEKVKSGTNTMLWAAIGVVLVFSSYVLVTNLFSMLIPTPPATTETATKATK